MEIVWGRNPASYQDDEMYNSLSLVGYADSSYARYVNDQKSIIEYYFFYVGAITT